jgi:small subunit ribosomal protein S16
MPVKIRLTRMGKKKQPSYRVVVVDSRRPRDGAYIEQIGRYDPRQDPSLIEIDNEKAVDWLRKGAQPSDRAKKLLEVSGAWTQFRVSRGDIHTIDAPTAALPEREIHVVGEDPAPEDDAPADAAVEEPAAEDAAVEEPAPEEPAVEEASADVGAPVESEDSSDAQPEPDGAAVDAEDGEEGEQS